MRRLNEMATAGLPFDFMSGTNRYTCRAVFKDNYAACEDSDGWFSLFESDKPLYSDPTRRIYSFLVQGSIDYRSITPILRLAFNSPEEAQSYCTAHDYAIIKQLAPEDI